MYYPLSLLVIFHRFSRLKKTHPLQTRRDFNHPTQPIISYLSLNHKNKVELVQGTHEELYCLQSTLTFSFAWISRIFLLASTCIWELTCFLVLVFPVRNLIYRAISSLRPKNHSHKQKPLQSLDCFYQFL